MLAGSFPSFGPLGYGAPAFGAPAAYPAPTRYPTWGVKIKSRIRSKIKCISGITLMKIELKSRVFKTKFMNINNLREFRQKTPKLFAKFCKTSFASSDF